MKWVSNNKKYDIKAEYIRALMHFTTLDWHEWDDFGDWRLYD